MIGLLEFWDPDFLFLGSGSEVGLYTNLWEVLYTVILVSGLQFRDWALYQYVGGSGCHIWLAIPLLLSCNKLLLKNT